MVRLLFIRHAESSQNVHQSANVDAAEMSEEEQLKAMRGASADEDGDFKLTTHGESQAEALGDMWAPVLEQAARRGKLHVFVSPMRRCLQTADPLMTALHKACGLKAMIKPSIMEFGGLTWPSDMGVFDEMADLRKQGDVEGAMKLLKTKAWKASGYSGNELQKAFPWADLPDGFPVDTPWHTGGFEGG